MHTDSQLCITREKRAGTVALRNHRLELLVEIGRRLNPHRLVDRASGTAFADADYLWADDVVAQPLGDPEIGDDTNGNPSALFKARVGDIEVHQRFTLPADEPDTLIETITIANPSDAIINTSEFACGFANVVGRRPGSLAPRNDRFSEIPYRVRPETGEWCEYSVVDLFGREAGFAVDRGWYDMPVSGTRVYSSTWGSEGWAWSRERTTLLIQKYNPDAMEWSLLGKFRRNVGAGKATENIAFAEGTAESEILLRFGGAGRWKLGDPEGAAMLAPGELFTFGQTRFHLISGDWKDAFYSFRRFTESKGHVVPPSFDPPVHWNELYDNPLWWPPAGDSPENRDKYYRREDMEIEARKAHELGCECLYLDPGWDTAFASCEWAEERLGPPKDFARWLRDEYGLALALHAPLAAWSDASEYPDDNWRKDKDGQNLGGLCSASRTWVEEKARRLVRLWEDGAYFLMFDGNWFTGECWDASHGHHLPPTRQDHLDATLALCRRVHQTCPDAVIELHDPIIGPGAPRYAPTHLLHAKPGSFDVLWGFEFMVHPLCDLDFRQAMSLYYFNLAYSIPVYLHIDLREDNQNALMFWWYASTCRHLGVGGKSRDPAIWQAHKDAMATYLEHKPFFTQGTFYGLEENIHVHALSEQDAAVVVCFNFEERDTVLEFPLTLSRVGLSATADVCVTGAEAIPSNGDLIRLSVPVPSRSAKILMVALDGATAESEHRVRGSAGNRGGEPHLLS